nr:hypothetical protein [Nocardia mexicana]
MIETVRSHRGSSGDGREQREQMRRQRRRQRPPPAGIYVQAVALRPDGGRGVALIDGDADTGTAQALGETEPAETRADHDDVRVRPSRARESRIMRT